jgi:putative Holliday junction resolvase
VTELPGEPSLIRGRRLALDFGLVRIGVSVSDPDGQFAFPTAVLATADWEEPLSRLLKEYEPVVLYVGYPINLSGDEGSSARFAREFAIEVAAIYTGEIRLVDERLTTKSAMNDFRMSGKSERDARSEIDALAATHLLEGILLGERNLQKFIGSRI